jgi:hypothetical protein
MWHHSLTLIIQGVINHYKIKKFTDPNPFGHIPVLDEIFFEADSPTHALPNPLFLRLDYAICGVL